VACDDKTFLLNAYLDGELDLMRSLELEEHLESCAACAGKLRSETTIRQALRSADLYARASAGLEQRIRESALGAEGGSHVRELTKDIRGNKPHRRLVLQWVAAAAAVLVVTALGIEFLPNILGRRQNTLLAQEIVASHIRSLQPGHLFDVESTDQHTVKPWFDGKLDFAPPVRDLADQGFPLVGGRLDYVGHRSVAALVYQRRKHIINVYVWPENSGDVTRDMSEQQATIDGYNLINWRYGEMEFCAVSDVNMQDLQNLAQLLKQ